MSKKNLFITGISGCVGHYVWDILKDDPDYHLYMLIRNPDRLRFKKEAQNKENVTIIQASMDHLPKYTELLKTMDGVVHLATDWGGNMNLEHTQELFELLDSNRCEKVLYFSTASILGPDNKPIPNAKEVGTSYIWRKWDMYKKLPELAIYPKVKVLFPTLIFGGDKDHPLSHTIVGLPKAMKWASLFRFFGFNGSFHFIHAADIAQMVKYLLKNNVEQKDLVLGQEPITFNMMIDELCKIAKKKIYFRKTITPRFMFGLAKLMHIKINSWDKYCLEHPHLRYKVTKPEDFGLKTLYPSMLGILQNTLKK